MLNCGDTFLTGDGDEDNFHLWIIVTPATEGEVVTVCLITEQKRSEKLVRLQQGDHPFINHASVIAYKYSSIRSVEDIEEMLRTGLAKQRDPVSPELLRRVRAGLLDSDHTPNGVRAYYKQVVPITE